MAKQCSRCETKVGLFSQKGWDIQTDGTKYILCARCCVEARSDLEGFNLNHGYNRIVYIPLPNLSLQVPLICVACGTPDADAAGCRKQELSISRSFTQSGWTRSYSPAGDDVETFVETFAFDVYVCPRCSGLGLMPQQFIRIRSGEESGGAGYKAVLIEIGNSEVAKQFRNVLDAGMKEVAEQYRLKLKEVEADNDVDLIKYGVMLDLANTCGVMSMKRLTPNNKGWVSA